MKAFDATLMGAAESLMGAVQDSEDKDDDVNAGPAWASAKERRDLPCRRLNAEEFLVHPVLSLLFEKCNCLREPAFHNFDIKHRSYRFVTFVEFGSSILVCPMGVRHEVAILYGVPSGHIWHEVFEAIASFPIITLVLLGVTAA